LEIKRRRLEVRRNAITTVTNYVDLHLLRMKALRGMR